MVLRSRLRLNDVVGQETKDTQRDSTGPLRAIDGSTPNVQHNSSEVVKPLPDRSVVIPRRFLDGGIRTSGKNQTKRLQAALVDNIWF